MFLTTEELQALTGYKRHADQRAWLTRRGWMFEVAASGRPIIGRAYAEQRLGAGTAIAAPRPVKQPNVAALRRSA